MLCYLCAALAFFSPAILGAVYIWAAPRFYEFTQRIHERNRNRCTASR